MWRCARVLDDEDCKTRFLDHVLTLVKVFALCASRDEAIAIRDDVRLFADVRAAIVKIEDPDSGRAGSGRDVAVDTAIGQLVNEAVMGDEVVDVYRLAGLDTPELSILSDGFQPVHQPGSHDGGDHRGAGTAGQAGARSGQPARTARAVRRRGRLLRRGVPERRGRAGTG